MNMDTNLRTILLSLVFTAEISAGTGGCTYHPVPDEKSARIGAAGSRVQGSSPTAREISAAPLSSLHGATAWHRHLRGCSRGAGIPQLARQTEAAAPQIPLQEYLPSVSPRPPFLGLQ